MKLIYLELETQDTIAKPKYIGVWWWCAVLTPGTVFIVTLYNIVSAFFTTGKINMKTMASITSKVSEVRKSGLSLEGWIVGGAERDDGEVSLQEPPSQIV